MKDKPWKKYLIFTLFCGAVYVPLFHHLTWEPIHNWDESLFAMRAGYMAEEGAYLPDYSHWVEGGPMHRNSKPPFTTWIQALSMKIFGVSELGLRLPVALSALATVFLFLWFFREKFGDVRIGYCAGFVLVTSLGYVRAHAARTGDQDVPLALYMLAGAFAFYQYIGEKDERKRWRWLALLTFLLIISALTKYVFGLLFLPAFFIYAIYKKELLNILKRRSTWLAALIFGVAVGGWLAVMEQRLPGFAERMFFYEMVHRYTTVIELHKAPFWYYFNNLWSGYFMPWLYLLPIPLAMVFYKTFRAYRDILLLMFLCALVLLLTVSFSQTKTTHYEIVAYPPLAFLAGIGLYQLVSVFFKLLKTIAGEYKIFLVTAGFWLAIVLVVKPYQKVFEKIYTPKLTQNEMKYGYLFRKIKAWRPGLKSFTLLHPGFAGQAAFYAGLYDRKMGYHIKMIKGAEGVVPGDTVMVCDKTIGKALFEKFHLQGLESYEECFVARVDSRLRTED
jgi:4-amino-4-deoxy-L-arabinose transferase-like glycosyltransferase